MKKLFIIVMVFGLLVGCDRGDFKTLDGQSFNQEAMAGRWMIVNYWASWCRPCLVEIPEFNKLYSEINPSKIAIFGVNFDGIEGQQLKEAANDFAIKFPLLITDPSLVMGFERPSMLPATYLISPSGELKDILLGPQTQETILAALKRHDLIE